MITAYIGVGSNQDRHQSIEAGLRALAELASQWRLSTIYECPSVGFASHPFFNLMVEMETELALPELMKQLKAIELRCGRLPNAQKYRDRTLNLILCCMAIVYRRMIQCCLDRISIAIRL